MDEVSIIGAHPEEYPAALPHLVTVVLVLEHLEDIPHQRLVLDSLESHQPEVFGCLF